MQLYDGIPRTKHVTTNLIVETDSDGRAASARSYYVALQGLRSSVAAHPRRPWHDRFEKVDGDWRFVERLIYIDLLGDVAVTSRAPPDDIGRVVTGAGRGMGRACAARLMDAVDVLLMVDRDESALEASAAAVESGKKRTTAIAFPLDITDSAGLERLATRAAELGTLRGVAHAAGVSPTMAEWRQVLEVDLVGTARLLEALEPTVVAGTAIVCFASIASGFVADVEPAVDTALDDPLHPQFLERLGAAVGSASKESGAAYVWAKRGVQRLVQREAVHLGRRGAESALSHPESLTPQWAGRRQPRDQ